MNPKATLWMENGKKIVLELLPEAAPNTVNSFISAASKGYFDQHAIERIVPGSWIDMSYTAFGHQECQYLIPNEFQLNPHIVPLDSHPGVVAMGGYGEHGLAGCEFFFPLRDCPEHKGIYPVFAKVLEGGMIKVGDKIKVIYPDKDMPYQAAVITLSDKGSRGERVDTSGPKASEILREHGFEIIEEILLPDEMAQIKKELIRLSDSRQVDLIITTGGTGLSPRDCTPEATLAVADRNVPGIAEAIRAGSMTITKRAMLSRGVSVTRKKTLIINLPGSKKAVEESLSFIIDQLPHGLDTLRGNTQDCGRN